MSPPARLPSSRPIATPDIARIGKENPSDPVLHGGSGSSDQEIADAVSYDPRVWGASAEAGLAARVVEATQQLGSAGKTF
jgi:fructose-bisphosphate aldolase, class II